MSKPSEDSAHPDKTWYIIHEDEVFVVKRYKDGPKRIEILFKKSIGAYIATWSDDFTNECYLKKWVYFTSPVRYFGVAQVAAFILAEKNSK